MLLVLGVKNHSTRYISEHLRNLSSSPNRNWLFGSLSLCKMSGGTKSVRWNEVRYPINFQTCHHQLTIFRLDKFHKFFYLCRHLSQQGEDWKDFLIFPSSCDLIARKSSKRSMTVRHEKLSRNSNQWLELILCKSFKSQKR